MFQIDRECTEVGTFITLNILTDTKKGCGPKILGKKPSVALT